MTAEQVSSLGPAFTDFLSPFRGCFPRRESFAHLGTYCRGPISDLARKSVEPIALAGGCAVRTLQEFLTHHAWDHDALLRQGGSGVILIYLLLPSCLGEPAFDKGERAAEGVRGTLGR